MSFANKVVVVTGGSSGIGAAIAIMFAKEDAKVVIVGRNETKLENVAKRCEEYGSRPFIIKADVSKEDETRSIITKTIEQFSRLDVLVNNAGHSNEATILSDNILQSYDEVMSVNLRAIVLLTSLAFPHLIKTKGNVINISSIPWLANLTFSISKAGLDHFTRCAALEFGPSGVRVNAINPGAVRTESLEEMFDDLSVWEKQSVLGKLAESSEIAGLVKFLASDRAASVTGANYFIDNGSSLIMPS